MAALDWSGRIVVVAAPGPSASRVDLAAAVAAGAVILAINESWRLWPGADALYACDAAWWRERGPAPERFHGLRFAGEAGAPGATVLPVTGADAPVWTGEALGAGGGSGFQAANLAAVSGARRVILSGYDLTLSRGAHWHGWHEPPLRNPSEASLARQAAALARLGVEMAARGIDAVDATRRPRVEGWRRATMTEALA